MSRNQHLNTDLKHTAVLAEFIADGIVGAWNALKRAAHVVKTDAAPAIYTTALPRRF